MCASQRTENKVQHSFNFFSMVNRGWLLRINRRVRDFQFMFTAHTFCFFWEGDDRLSNPNAISQQHNGGHHWSQWFWLSPQPNFSWHSESEQKPFLKIYLYALPTSFSIEAPEHGSFIFLIHPTRLELLYQTLRKLYGSKSDLYKVQFYIYWGISGDYWRLVAREIFIYLFIYLFSSFSKVNNQQLEIEIPWTGAELIIILTVK